MSFCPLKGPQENGHASYLPPLIELVVIIGSYAFAPYGRFNFAPQKKNKKREHIIEFYFILFLYEEF
jgi:hypothetical protein